MASTKTACGQSESPRPILRGPMDFSGCGPLLPRMDHSWSASPPGGLASRHAKRALRRSTSTSGASTRIASSPSDSRVGAREMVRTLMNAVGIRLCVIDQERG